MWTQVEDSLRRTIFKILSVIFLNNGWSWAKKTMPVVTPSMLILLVETVFIDKVLNLQHNLNSQPKSCIEDTTYYGIGIV